MTENERKLLQKELKALDNAAKILSESFDHCQKIGIKTTYTFLDSTHLEALTSRFARLSDLMIRRIFRLINLLDYEPQQTIRDSIHRAEKLGIIANAEVFAGIRETRNTIAHEYMLEDLSELYQNVFQNTPHLLDTVKRVKDYCKKYKGV